MNIVDNRTYKDSKQLCDLCVGQGFEWDDHFYIKCDSDLAFDVVMDELIDFDRAEFVRPIDLKIIVEN